MIEKKKVITRLINENKVFNARLTAGDIGKKIRREEVGL